MTEMTEPEGLTAALLQLAALTQKLAGIEFRQAADARDVQARITDLARAADQAQATIGGHGQALAALDGLDAQVSELAARLADLTGPGDGPAAGTGGYRPSAQPRFWRLEGEERDAAIARLRAWVDQIYRPGYGHLSASLGECWDQHPLCLYILDWLSELWSVLYLAATRTTGTVASQAEWHTRLLGAAAEQLARETRSCGHRSDRWRPPARPGARP